MRMQPIAMNARFPRWTETLGDGSQVVIRPITKSDSVAERAFIEGLSPTSRRMRFLGQVGIPSDEMIQNFIDIDYVQDVAFAATIPEASKDRFVGVSRYGTDAAGIRCECAVVVSDAWQGRGLGTALMKHLIEVARSRGIRSMYSLDSSANHAMSDLAHYLGFSSRPDPDDATQTLHELTL